jgi:hypothetical protein
MDLGGQARRPFPTADAQIHLEPHTAGSLSDLHTLQAVILSREDDEGSLARRWFTQDSSCDSATLREVPRSARDDNVVRAMVFS